MTNDSLSVLIGLLYAFLSLFLFILNLVDFLILTRYSEYKTLAYFIIKHMLFGCLMQLGSLFIGAIMTIFNTNFHWILERLVGAWLQSGWFLYLGSSLALAVERSLTFITYNHDDRTRRITYACLCLAWILAIFYFVALNIPGFGFTYFSSKGCYSWFYTSDQEGSYHLLILEIFLDFTILVTCLILYVIVVIQIASRKSSLVVSSCTMAEYRILATSLISFCYESTYLLWFFWGINLIADQMFISVIVSVLWIVDCGFLSILTIIINSSFREKIFAQFRSTKTKVVRIAIASR
uniref:G_PROTEIN_RECEP_F1_2 domain-containing protein n=1 Tax=Steinernema glaseri TaxID=37863 RepID=A0A1I8AVT1_9BILA